MDRAEALTHAIVGFETELGIAVDGSTGAAREEPGGLYSAVTKALFQRVRHVCDQSGGAHLECGGARVYHDSGHLEMATGEARTPRALVLHERALEELLVRAAREARSPAGAPIVLFKSNIDYLDAQISYGAHESYLVRGRTLGSLAAPLIPFLVTKPLYAGAGCIAPGGAWFELSQRARFMELDFGHRTVDSRAILNSKDESLMARGTPENWKRLHLICGDACRSEYSEYVRASTTLLVLAALQAGYLERVPELSGPAPEIMRQVSRDLAGKERIARGPQPMRAVEVQAWYHDRVADYLGSLPSVPPWALEAHWLWGRLLTVLASDPAALAPLLDCWAKYAVFNRYLSSRKKTWRDVSRERGLFLDLALLDVSFSSLDPATSLYQALVYQGAIQTLFRPAEVQATLLSSPPGTRGALRGRAIAEIAGKPPAERRVQPWASWEFVFDHLGRRLDLGNPFETEERWSAPAPLPGDAAKKAPEVLVEASGESLIPSIRQPGARDSR